jgi:hypothetical protein
MVYQMEIFVYNLHHATCAAPQIIYTNGLTVYSKTPPTIANAGSDQIIYGTSTSLTANNAILE